MLTSNILSMNLQSEVELALESRAGDLTLRRPGRVLPTWFRRLCDPGSPLSVKNLSPETVSILRRLSTRDDFAVLYWPTLEPLVSFVSQDSHDPEASVRDQAIRASITLQSVHPWEAIAREFKLPSELLNDIRNIGPDTTSADLRNIRSHLERRLIATFRPLFKRLQQRMGRITKVEILESELVAFPAELAGLTGLQELLIDHRGSPTPAVPIDLPQDSPSFGTLQSLTIAKGQIASEPITNAAFPILESLALVECALPPAITIRLEHLRTLVITGDSSFDLRGAPSTVLKLEAASLEEVDFEGALGLTFDAALGRQSGLTTVCINGTGLDELPPLSSDSLLVLRASGNSFRGLNLTAIASSAQSLQVLELSGCGIVELPPEISQFESLSVLDISDNELAVLPTSLGKMAALSDVSIGGNPLPDLYSAAAMTGTQTLKRFLADLGQEPGRCNEAKLLMVGEGTVGKTSLLAALKGEEFQPDRETTHGIEIRRIPLTSNEDGTLIAWDFGGQEIYRVTHPFFFSKNAIYAVTWRPRDGMEQTGVKYWLESIRYRVGTADCKILLVETHASEGRRSLLDPEEVTFSYYPAIIAHLSVDSATGSGISELHAMVSRAATELPQWGEPIPETWLALRRELRDVERSFLLLGEYEDLAVSCGVARENARACAAFLHTLGDILFFDDSDGLGAVIVVDPELLARAVSFILEDVPTKERGGEIALEDVRALWLHRDEQIRTHPDVFSVLVGLMMRFDIAYQVTAPGGARGLLLPEMLSSQRPLDLPWEPGDEVRPGQRELRVQLRLNRIPEGLIPWIIVRNFRALTGYKWRHGALFCNPEHDASCLVEVGDASVVSITCRGAYVLDLFTTIKSDVERVLADRWPYLRREVLVPCPNRARGCDGVFEHDYLVRAERARKSTVECRSCLATPTVASLVTSVSGSVSSRELLVRHLESIRRPGVEQSELLGEISSSLRFIREEFASALGETPSLFTIRPSNWNKGRRVTVGLFRSRFEVRLFCEWPAGPHPLGDPYFVTPSREWFGRALPVLRAVSALLALIPSVGQGIANAVSSEIALALDFVERLASEEATLGSPRVPGSLAQTQFRGRLIRELLLEVDPAPSQFRGLARVTLPGRPAAWLCPDHVEAVQLERVPT